MRDAESRILAIESRLAFMERRIGSDEQAASALEQRGQAGRSPAWIPPATAVLNVVGLADSATAAVLAGVLVEVFDEASTPLASGLTDGAGDLSLTYTGTESLLTGPVIVHLSASGYYPRVRIYPVLAEHSGVLVYSMEFTTLLHI